VTVRPGLWLSSVRETGKTSEDLLRETVPRPEVRHILRSLGYPVMSLAFAAYWWYSIFEDYWYPLGGMRAITDALVAAFLATGGELRLGTKVEAILVSAAGRASGVRVEPSEVIEGDIVVSTADLDWTLSALENAPGPERPAGRKLAAPRARVAAAVPSETLFSAYLGLKTEPGEMERQTYATAVYGDPADASDEPAFVYLHTQTDPASAPAGHAAATVHWMADYDEWARLAGLPHRIPGELAPRRGPEAQARPAAYREAKAAGITRAVERVSRLLPGLGGRLVVRDAATPVTYERYTGNLAGSSVGWSWNPSHKGIRLGRGPLPGLACAGHWTYTPGGIPTALLTGYMVGRQL